VPDETSQDVTNEMTELSSLASADLPKWREVWQLPALVASLLLFTFGVAALVMSRPSNDFAKSIAVAEAFAYEAQYDQGLAVVEELLNHLNEMAPAEQAALHAVRADLFYGKQGLSGGLEKENLSQVVFDYREAEKLGLAMTPIRQYRMTDSLITLSKINEALKSYTKLPVTESDLRHQILKRLVEHNLTLPDMNFVATYELLGALLGEPDLAAEDRVWAVARRAELQIEQRYTNEAVSGLLVTIQQLKAEGIEDFSELYVLLGRGYYEIGEMDKATQHLLTVLELLPQADPDRAEALLLLGRIAHTAGRWDEAYYRYESILNEYPDTVPVLPAMLGRAEVLARQEEYRSALDDYTRLVSRLVREYEKTGHDRRDLMPIVVVDSVLTWHDLLIGQGKPEMAIRFATAGERLYDTRGGVPNRLLLSLARTNKTLGDKKLAKAWESTAEGGTTDFVEVMEQHPEIVPVRIDAASKLDARSHYLSSGEYNRRLAMNLQIDDPNGTAEAFQDAADAFDRGGDYERAIESLKEFILLSAHHPRQLLGIYRLGRCYQAMEEYPLAIEQYRKLIDDPKRRVSPEGYRSYVPLAKCYLSDPDHPDAAEAERLLRTVVDGRQAVGDGGAGLEPEAVEFRNALLELGTLYARAADYDLPNETASYYPLAIKRLTEAVERYPDDPRIHDLHARLGDAYRLSAESIAEQMNLERPLSEQEMLGQQQMVHLDHAVTHYDEAVRGYESIAVHQRSELEREMLKLTSFWKADCLFELERYDEAIEAYALITNRYIGEPTALVAQARIITAYAEQGEMDKARTAQTLAFRMLQKMPESAFEESLLSRDAWEQWLKWGPLLDDKMSAVSP